MTDNPKSRRSFFNPKQAAREFTDSSLEPTESAIEVVSDEEKARQRSESYIFEVSRSAMACEFSIIVNDGLDSENADLMIEALDLVEELEAEMTVYRDSSRVMAINRDGFREPVFVSPRLLALLKRAIEIYEFTKGAFDITAGPLTKVWGFYRREGNVPDEDALAAALEKVGSQWLSLDEPEFEARLLKEGIELNLGGIGKGFALDECVKKLSTYQMENFLIHGGQSSVVARGNRAGIDKRGRRGWTIGLKHPVWKGKRLAEIFLYNRALGTSGTARQAFIHKGRRYGHIIDPRTGQPAEGTFSTTVMAPTAAEADALATAFYVLGAEKSLELCKQRPDISAIIVTPGEKQGGVEVHTANLEDQDWLLLE